MEYWILFHFLFTLYLLFNVFIILKKRNKKDSAEYWKHNLPFGLVTLCVAVLTPFMFFFSYAYNVIPNGNYRISVTVSKDGGKEYVLPCDMEVYTVDEYYTYRDSEKIEYSQEYFLRYAYWPNGATIAIEEPIDPSGGKLDLDKMDGYYVIKTPEITQSVVGLTPKTILLERATSLTGLFYLVSEIFSLYVAYNFVCALLSMQKDEPAKSI